MKFEGTPTEADKKLLHSVADRMWEWAKQIEDDNTRVTLKELVSDIHYLAEKK